MSYGARSTLTAHPLHGSAKHQVMGTLVSIIIPAYNSRAWLGEAVDSALAQTHPSCEILVIDDGSTDGTDEWLRETYGAQIRYLWKENGGLSSARNHGLRHANGKYTQFLDADDIILPEKVAVHAKYLDSHPDVDIVYCHGMVFSDDPVRELRDWPRRSLYRSGQIFAGMLDEGYLMTHMTMSRRESLERVGGFDEALTSCIDWDYWLRVAYAGATFHILEGPPMALYRVREGSKSQTYDNHALNGLKVLAKVADYVKDPKERRLLNLTRLRGSWRFRHGKGLVETGHLRRGMWEMTRSLLADPRNLDYKLSYIALAPFLGAERVAKAQGAVKRANDYFLRRRQTDVD